MVNFQKKTSNQTLGQRGEQLASLFLERRGYSVVARNWRFGRCGEVDLLLEKPDLLVFVEVKTRRNHRYGAPVEAVTLKKQETLRVLADAYLQQHSVGVGLNVRFDVVSILYTGAEATIHHLENAF